ATRRQGQGRQRHRSWRHERCARPIPPLVVVLADVAHLYLPTCREGWYVGEKSPLEQLHKPNLGLTADYDVRPHRLRDRIAHNVHPIKELLRDDLARRLFNQALLVQVIPENGGDIMPRFRYVLGITFTWNSSRRSSLSNEHAC